MRRGGAGALYRGSEQERERQTDRWHVAHKERHTRKRGEEGGDEEGAWNAAE